jgi:hypothetical protein
VGGNNNNNINNNSIHIYLCANLTAQRPITKLAQVEIQNIIKKEIQNMAVYTMKMN